MKSDIVRSVLSLPIDMCRGPRRIRSEIHKGIATAWRTTIIRLPCLADWRQTEDYLYGVDLYNFAYWWEAHEAWEGLWNKTEDDCRLFLQGLIQISAALIKYHMRQLRGLQSLSTNGRNKLHQVLTNLDDPTGMYMGMNLPEFLACLDTFCDPFFSDTVSEQTYSHVTVKPLIHLHL